MTNKRFQAIIKELFIRCRKLNIYHAVLFQCSKTSQIKFYTLSNNENHNKRELQQIAINHSADIDYKNFLKIYRKCTKEPYSFLTIDTTLPANNPMRFKKKFSDSPL